MDFFVILGPGRYFSLGYPLLFMLCRNDVFVRKNTPGENKDLPVDGKVNGNLSCILDGLGNDVSLDDGARLYGNVMKIADIFLIQFAKRSPVCV